MKTIEIHLSPILSPQQNAAKFYKEFARDPKLAGFLRKIDALRLIMEKGTTLVIDTNVPPFDLLKADAAIPGAADSNAK